MNNIYYDELERKIGYSFQDKLKLKTALTHKSFSNENMLNNVESYERYEFLGDAILEYIVSNYLYREYPDLSEGELTKLRASLVCEFTLSKISRELRLGEYGYFSKGELNTGGNNRDSILCDMFESLLGAIYLDSGIDEAGSFVKRFLLTDIEHKQLFYDAKTKLQEYSQKHNKTLYYELINTEGPEHNKIYYVELLLDDEVISQGEGHSKKNAEQMAAYNALCVLEKKYSG
ncbi:MAG: ribonuclease III [Wujia sp.]